MASVNVVCVCLSRKLAREEYRPRDYQVCLLEGTCLPRGAVQAGEEPERAALRTAREKLGLKGCAAVSLAVHRTPSQSSCSVTILYVVPVEDSGTPTSCQFCSLSSVVIDPSIDEQERTMLQCVDQWLQERHALPFLDPSLYFLGGGEEGGAGGVVKAIIENPVFLCQAAPPEDQLVISLNNPTFSADLSTLDLHATQA